MLEIRNKKLEVRRSEVKFKQSYPSAPSCSECSPPKLSERSECSPPYLSAFLVSNSTCSPLANAVAKR